MAWVKNWFSNMLPMDKPLIVGDIKFPTVENYYQAMKFGAEDTVRLIAGMNPYAAKKYAATYRKQFELNPKFDRLVVMEEGLRFKFAPGTTWHKKLMDTGNEEIVEWNNWHDLYWGKDVVTKEGENHLGRILMKLRAEFREVI